MHDWRPNARSSWAPLRGWAPHHCGAGLLRAHLFSVEKLHFPLLHSRSAYDRASFVCSSMRPIFVRPLDRFVMLVPPIAHFRPDLVVPTSDLGVYGAALR